VTTELPVLCCAPVSSVTLTEEEVDATARIFKALGDPHRVRIVNQLVNAHGPVCVCDFTATLGISQPTVSFHLKKLLDSGLISREQRGTWAYYSIDPDAFARLREVVAMKEAV
jgi:ArsR family transcriptional regulator